MPLDPKGQAILDIYCYLFQKVLDHLDLFDEQASAIDGCDCYAVINSCFDPATREFGSILPSTSEKSELLNNFLVKIEGLFSYKYSYYPDLINCFQSFKINVLKASEIALLSDITDSFIKAEEMSREYFSLFCGSDYVGTRRPATLTITRAGQFSISCMPDKNGGESVVTFRFATEDFDFLTYANMPFYFFHEYLSHIHSATLFNEHDLSQKSHFEDGWLMYLAFVLYKKSLNNSGDKHREHFLNKYFYSKLYPDSPDSEIFCLRAGYELATSFETIVGQDMFYKISFLLTSTNHDSITSYYPIHTKFLFRVKKWIELYSKRTSDDKTEQLGMLNLALEDEHPVKTLLDILIE